jgi:hypothetical protein
MAKNIYIHFNYCIIIFTSGSESEDFSFTFIDTEDYTDSGKWQKIFISILIIIIFKSGSVAQR